MQIKTFKAVDMPEALRMVKSEFGTDAMILSSRKQRREGLLSRFSKPYYEVTAALDISPRATQSQRPERETDEPNTLDAFQKSMLAPMARELKELRTLVQSLTSKESAGNRVQPPQARAQREPEVEKPALKASPAALPSSEVEELKKVLLRHLVNPDDSGAKRPAGLAKQPPARTGTDHAAPLAGILRSNGVDEEAITRLMIPVAAAAARGETPDRLRELLVRSVADEVTCSGPFKLRKNAPRILALVGPTGVGKTTTIAKLAALAYKKGVTVALITIDTFRIGAVAQLQTYSGIMDMPMEIASTPEELAAAIRAHADKQLIFIDTAGRNPRDRNKILEMKSFLEVNPDIETHLCLSATTRDRELTQAVTRFGALPISRLLFTKLDESMSFGCIVNTHLQNKLPLSYFTTGQRVPEDIETATPQRVANLVAREMKR